MSTGRRISRYLILRQLGHGNLTRVFLATVRGADRHELCVLKLMRPELAADDDFRALFLDQAATTLSLSHPNLVPTVDVVADAEACGLTMKFLEGQTLARVIERMGRTRFPVDMHLHVLSKVLAALDYAHSRPRTGESRPFFHGDVCPANVFLTHEGEVKLLGTGFAEATRALETKLGRPLTDVRYTAPEALLGQPSGPSMDVFGVGIMLWEAVARQARVAGDDGTAIIQQRTNGEEPDLEKAWPDAPVPVIDMCRRALAMDPNARYGSAAELRSDLEAYLGRASQSSDAVLQRLAESTQQLFAAEREQMQLFIGSTLGSVSDHTIPSPGPRLDADDELTPHGEEWNAPTSARIPALDMLATGNLALVANATASEGAPLAHQERDPGVASSETDAAMEGMDTPPLDPVPEASLRQPPPRLLPLELGPPRDSSTGGHRAYSTSLEASPLRRPGKLRLSPDVLGAAALLIGSIVAAYSLHRHTTREKRMESEQLAIQAEARVALPPTSAEPGGSESGGAEAAPPERSHPKPSSRGAPERETVDSIAEARPALVPAPADGDRATIAAAPTRAEGSSLAKSAADAGPGVERRTPVSAFFDGVATAPKARAVDSPASVDDLPTVDPALDSLQDAILTQARRRAGRTPERDKRDNKKPDPGASAMTGGSPLMHPNEDIDLATGPGSD